MKKYKLQKGILAGALTAAICLTGCEKNVNNSLEINNGLTINYESNNQEFKTEINNVQNDTNQISKIVEEAISPAESTEVTLTTEIEQVELENGEIGYKLPVDYFPYAVNKEYYMPGMVAVEEQTPKYTIFALPTSIDENGIEVETSFEGAIGVYKPYFEFLSHKETLLNKYNISSDTVIEDYSFASSEDQELLYLMDAIENKVTEDYNNSRGNSLKK